MRASAHTRIERSLTAAGKRFRPIAVAFLLALGLAAPASHVSAAPASGAEWRTRFISAARANKTEEAADALETLARQWPAEIARLGQTHEAQLVFRVVQSAAPQRKYKLSAALFTANWTLEPGVQPNGVWLDLARKELERSNLQQAIKVAARITDAEALLVMRVDKLFEPVLHAMPERFDIKAAVDQDVSFWQDKSARFPRRLAYVMELQYALLRAGRYDEVVSVADDVIAGSPGIIAAKANYDDGNDYYNWILDNRGRALENLGSWVKAERDMKRAAQLQERGNPNVSNAINLATFYARLGRSPEARAALGKLATSTESTSPYGRMQVDAVLLRIALTSGEKPGVTAALDRMRENQEASLSTFQEALIVANQLDEAAKLLIRRVGNPETRTDALLDVQIYLSGAPSPDDRIIAERWDVLRARQDVTSAIAKYGRIERVPMSRPLF